MKIATFNINNVVRRLPNLLAWLRAAAPDVVCLQELKAADASFPRRGHRGCRLRGGLAGTADLERRRDPGEGPKADPGAGRIAGRSCGHAEPLHRGGRGRRADRLHLPAERQSAARAEVRLQARLVRPAHRACGRAARSGRAGHPRRRLQRRADRSGHLPDQVLGERCAAAAGKPGGVRASSGPGLDRCDPHAASRGAHVHVLGLQAEPLAAERGPPSRPPPAQPPAGSAAWRTPGSIATSAERSAPAITRRPGSSFADDEPRRPHSDLGMRPHHRGAPGACWQSRCC